MGHSDNHRCEFGFAEPAVVFKGPTQTARLVTEAWVALHGFCPNCSADRLPQLPNNSPVADFRCDACLPFPLWSFRGSVARPGTQRRAQARPGGRRVAAKLSGAPMRGQVAFGASPGRASRARG